MKLFRVLHLSDIHIGNTYMDSKDIAYRIISDIETENITGIKCVIVTGDIFEGRCGYTEEIVSEAIEFFNVIYEELQESTDIKKTDFLFVPGNHDIIRIGDTSKRWEKFRAFLTGFYGTIPDCYDLSDFSLLKIYEDSRIVFAGFNSCGLKEEAMVSTEFVNDIKRIEESQFATAGINKQDLINFMNNQTKTKTFIDYGEITPKQILKIKRELNKYDDYNIVAFFHHHFYLFPEVYSKYGDSSLIRNYTNIIQHLQTAHVRTVLHGHKHFDMERPMITDSYYENPNDIINIIAGGSVGTRRVEKHTFNIIDFYDKDSDMELVQRKFVYNNDQQIPVSIRQIPPKKVRENNASIKLLNLFELNDPDLFSKYTEVIDKFNIIVDDYNNMLRWLESLFVGFAEIHKIFEADSLCVFFLLYAVNYRILKIKQILGKESFDSSYYELLKDLLFNGISDVGFDKKQYLKIFDQSDLINLKEKSDELFSTIQTKKSKYYFAFSMIGIFFTDIYLMLRYYAGSFYKRYIKYKVNIQLDETEFHQNVPVQKIMIHSDADRRSAFIDLRCNSATAHKLAVLFVKEFELIISKFEDYFKTVGLKLYYLTPKIEKNNMSNTIDNYNFEAYIPTLIPLLTGDNIYARKEVFARELIQNSIDAIEVRASIDSDFDKKIYITLDQTQGRKFFRIKDYGTGMDRFKIERYFTSIGRSFYSGEEYNDLEIAYKPISNFGIGFLSAFMICREIDVKTRYYLDDKEGLKLHIPNYDGCFFIEKDDKIDIGTEITLYIDKKISHDIEVKNIVDYICDTMKDISCDILIKDEINKKEVLLEAKNVRKKTPNTDILFIPFSENNGVVENIHVANDVRTGAFINEYPYGLLININDEKSFGGVLNSGIKLYDTAATDIMRMLYGSEKRRSFWLDNHFLFNFPSNYLNIDVSREKIANLNEAVRTSEFKIKLMNEFTKQIMEYINICKSDISETKAISVHSLMMTMAEYCKQNQEVSRIGSQLMSMRYVLYIRFNKSTVELIIGRQENKPANAFAFMQSNYSKYYEAFEEFLDTNFPEEVSGLSKSQKEYLHMIPPVVKEFMIRKDYLLSRTFDEYHYSYKHMLSEGFRSEIFQYIQGELKSKGEKIVYAFLVLAAFLLKDAGDKIHANIMDYILFIFLERYTVSEIENKECGIELRCYDIKKVINKLK